MFTMRYVSHIIYAWVCFSGECLCFALPKGFSGILLGLFKQFQVYNLNDSHNDIDLYQKDDEHKDGDHKDDDN